jgi:diaminohydroxyphosphoribosylaminopyrimidine deaminase/5-amino-6-(5-phosphoribosylamino)uracil reductase
MSAATHTQHMQRALELAAQARGRTSPNPMVGAVIVRAGRVVGEGYHRQAGTPHAEVHALRAAGDLARGATLYVNLEPCNHQGRTPPCTEALIAAGIAEVHMAMLDPNPLVNGQGRARLEAAGIRTVVGECAEPARELNEAFVTYITAGRPFVIGKFAASLDGKIATRTGESRWITGEAARLRGHELRDTVDAILVGAATVIADDPLLTTRRPGREVRHPLRVVLDSRGRVPLEARVLDPALPAKTLLAATAALPAERRAALESRGVEVLVLPADAQGRVDLAALLETLGRRQVTSLLVEGGGTVLASFFQAGLVDKVVAFLAPLVIGGQEAPSAVSGTGVAHLADAARLERVQVERVGEDVLVTGYLQTYPPSPPPETGGGSLAD